jgi:hypothetical protein
VHFPWDSYTLELGETPPVGKMGKDAAAVLSSRTTESRPKPNYRGPRTRQAVRQLNGHTITDIMLWIEACP